MTGTPPHGTQVPGHPDGVTRVMPGVQQGPPVGAPGSSAGRPLPGPPRPRATGGRTRTGGAPAAEPGRPRTAAEVEQNLSRTLRNDYRHFRNWLKSRCLTVRYGLPILGILLLVDLLMKGWEIVSLIGRGLSLSFNFLSNNLAASVTAIGVLAAFVAVYFCAKLFYKLQASRQRLAQLEALVARTHASNEDE